MFNRIIETDTALSDNWAQMTKEERRKYRLDNFLSTEGRKFVSPEAEKMYRIRAQRIVDVMNVEEPDRLPVNLPVGSLPLTLYGLSTYDSFYNHEKVIEAYMKFNEEYGEELEYFATPAGVPGKALEILDYKIYDWPGYGIPEDGYGWQYVEGEYMTVDEYDELILDPSDFWMRKYLPRVFGSFGPLNRLQTLTNITENVHLGQILNPLANPATREMLNKMLQAGEEYQKVMQITGKYMGMSLANGFPMMGSVFCKAPFDTIGDTLRGTSGIMMDMYRCPDKLLKALDVVADLTIHAAKNSPGVNRAVQAGYPLHKGADGWMSQEQFDTFYWPSLKKVMDALIEEGLIQRLFAEGGFNTRLEAVNQFPRGFVTWYFDRSDMALVKKVLGDKCCIQGNVPIGLMVSGTPAEVKEHCRNLIETCGKGGGYILAAGTAGSNAKIDNLRAMMEAVREYGVYR